jgi:hypothetical protein
MLDDYEAIVDATCIAWNKLKADAGRIASVENSESEIMAAGMITLILPQKPAAIRGDLRRH